MVMHFFPVIVIQRPTEPYTYVFFVLFFFQNPLFTLLNNLARLAYHTFKIFIIKPEHEKRKKKKTE